MMKGAVGERCLAHPDDAWEDRLIQDGGSPWLLDCSDEDERRKELTLNCQCHVSLE